MKFDISHTGGAIILRLLESRLDTSISSLLKGEFLIICTPEVHELIVDLGQVEFCDSSGLSALLFAERQMRGHDGVVKLTGLHEKVASLIKISHLDRVFEIYENVEDAVAGRSNGAEG